MTAANHESHSGRDARGVVFTVRRLSRLREPTSQKESPTVESINRREFLDRSQKGLVGLAASMPIVAAATVAHTAQDGPKRRPTVMCVYYPHWHSYDHGSAWKGEGWTEWEGVKAAVPRFPGHQQPLRPTWGYFDESDPQWSAAKSTWRPTTGSTSSFSCRRTGITGRR